MLTPAFHFQILELFVSTFNTVTDTLVEKMGGEAGKKATNIFPYISLSALDVICGKLPDYNPKPKPYIPCSS